ncbi:hypothetical protein J6590_086724 [Homalodisca vitripennis]|nr:hypothetical protein J6590_086724 [Homalodisca vitripennis]
MALSRKELWTENIELKSVLLNLQLKGTLSLDHSIQLDILLLQVTDLLLVANSSATETPGRPPAIAQTLAAVRPENWWLKTTLKVLEAEVCLREEAAKKKDSPQSGTRKDGLTLIKRKSKKRQSRRHLAGLVQQRGDLSTRVLTDNCSPQLFGRHCVDHDLPRNHAVNQQIVLVKSFTKKSFAFDMRELSYWNSIQLEDAGLLTTACVCDCPARGCCAILWWEPSVAALGQQLQVPRLCTRPLLFPLLVSVPLPRLCPGHLSQDSRCLQRGQGHSRTTTSQRL